MTFFVEGLSGHLEPKSQVRRIGECNTAAEAVAMAQKAVDAFLLREFKAGMEAKALFAIYQSRGEYPFIFRDDDKTFNVRNFNHFHYALTRSGELCKAK